MSIPPALRWHRLRASLLTVWLLLSPIGLVGAAIQPSRDAGQSATLKTGGNLALLAAQSSASAISRPTANARFANC